MEKNGKTYCDYCGEPVLMSWTCPSCNRLICDICSGMSDPVEAKPKDMGGFTLQTLGGGEASCPYCDGEVEHDIDLPETAFVYEEPTRLTKGEITISKIRMMLWSTRVQKEIKRRKASVHQGGDADSILRIALHDESPIVRLEAIKKVEDMQVLMKLACDKDKGIAFTAFSMLDDMSIMREIAIRARRDDVRKWAILYVDDEDFSKTLVLDNEQIPIRQFAVRLIADEEFLLQLINEDRTPKEVKAAAVGGIETEDTLLHIASKHCECDESGFAWNLINQFHSLDALHRLLAASRKNYVKEWAAWTVEKTKDLKGTNARDLMSENISQIFDQERLIRLESKHNSKEIRDAAREQIDRITLSPHEFAKKHYELYLDAMDNPRVAREKLKAEFEEMKGRPRKKFIQVLNACEDLDPVRESEIVAYWGKPGQMSEIRGDSYTSGSAATYRIAKGHKDAAFQLDHLPITDPLRIEVRRHFILIELRYNDNDLCVRHVLFRDFTGGYSVHDAYIRSMDR